jgi:Cd2+/Zn2+-exporting ATPase
LAKTDVVVFDKTGTMTKGVFEVTKVKSVGVSEEELLRLTSLAESYSTHPISRSIIAHYEDKYKTEVCKDKVLEVNEVGGKGVNAVIEGHQVSVGNAKLMQDEGINADGLSKVNGAGANGSASKDREADDTALSAEVGSAQAGTVVHVSIEGAYAGYILISDVIKETAVSAVERLRKAGVGKLVMLTGDSKAAAKEIADTLKVDEVYSELLPEDKVSHVEELMTAKKSGRSLCFVGDGINDAPVLARADIGIAMGALGSDAAIEAADVVLMDDDPVNIALSIKIARKCIRIVYENIYFAIGIKVLCLILGALGIANMWWAIFADVGVMVLAVLNAIRALFNK